MELPETRYAKTADGVYIAYQTLGTGPIDIAWQFEWLGNVDAIWQARPYAEWFRGLASFSRLILHDRRGTGASSRDVDAPDLETRVTDLLTVLDAVGAERPVLGAALEGGAPNVLFAATIPERVHSLFWWYPAPRSTMAPDYPWGQTDELLDRDMRAAVEMWGTPEYEAWWNEPAPAGTEPVPGIGPAAGRPPRTADGDPGRGGRTRVDLAADRCQGNLACRECPHAPHGQGP